ncbi:multiple sugar transport system substrate-binding protein [Clostridium amylolyticum]|uniref:Multiple sugar transport system substrate-binding protein n=1 Tax=Clostridium amylolyticum TaxID=1121298 RepID=A0A1M6GQ37_9CLOT|nr:sugar ABC transporter substrate-binding protein [Clostridium amylolyticum]SHJ12063.1 multiple sugar transport system substrate-binding protein [Clostridium amylolyticum]
MKRNFVKGIKALLCVTLVGTALVGCSSGNANKSEKVTDGKIVLKYATGDSGPAVEVQEEIVKEFNNSQEKIEVKLETYGTAFDQKLAAAIGAGTAPDVVKMWNFPAYYKSLVPLNDYIDKLEDKKDFYSTLFNYANMKDKIYGMPIGFSTRAIHYNKDLVEKAGVEIKDSWNFNDFKEASKKITKGDNYGFYFYYNPDPYALESFLWSNGGEWLNDAGKPVINSRNNKEVLQALHDMVYKDKVAFAANLGDDFGQAFSSGKYGFAEMGKWFIPSINDTGLKLGIAPMPGFKDGNGMSAVHAAFLSVTTSSKNQDAAWEFIKFYTSKESTKKLQKIEMPVRESVAKELGLLDDAQIKPFYTMLERSVSKRPSLVKSEKWPEVSSEVAAGLESIFAQQNADVSKILDDVQKKVEEITK